MAVIRHDFQIEVDPTRVLLSRSHALQRLWDKIERLAPTDVTVLVSGETGTGKELVARLLHKHSARGHRELVALDCNAASPTLLESELFGHEKGAFTGADQARPGLFELADGSTLFLDEIGNLPLEAQAKLLRVLQEREFRRLGGRKLMRSDFRLITATNTDLDLATRNGALREDLLHRLRVAHIALPPLRERREDIPLLVGHFVDRKRTRLRRPSVCRVSQAAMDILSAYHWPGNVRQLENVVEMAILDCPGSIIDVEHLRLEGELPAPAPTSSEIGDRSFREARQLALASFERVYLVAQLRRFRGRITKIAEHSGITDKHVRALMRRHGLDRRDFRPPLRARGTEPQASR